MTSGWTAGARICSLVFEASAALFLTQGRQVTAFACGLQGQHHDTECRLADMSVQLERALSANAMLEGRNQLLEQFVGLQVTSALPADPPTHCCLLLQRHPKHRRALPAACRLPQLDAAVCAVCRPGVYCALIGQFLLGSHLHFGPDPPQAKYTAPGGPPPPVHTDTWWLDAVTRQMVEQRLNLSGMLTFTLRGGRPINLTREQAKRRCRLLPHGCCCSA